MAELRKTPLSVVVAALSAGMAGSAVNALDLEEVVVTASPIKGATKMESSVSVTSISEDAIANFTPRSEADVLLMIPGIRAENTGGGGGNSNITVRGLPIAAGGAKYVQLQEDGMPVIEFGDIAFGNNDYWLRYDYTVERVEAIRGGSASTLASHAPGAVINYISKTGEEAGGTIGLTTGLDYDETRVDFEYGSPVTDLIRFHVGGYYRSGEGPREVSYNALEGYQLKANLTKEFEDDSGFIRVYVKRLDERAPTYTSYPMTADLGGKTVSDFGDFPGFDARSETNISKHYRTFLTVNGAGETIVGRADGIEPEVNGFGITLLKDLSDKWTLENRFRHNDTSGIFAAPFMNLTPFEGFVQGYAVTVADGTTYQAAEARYANGPLAGQVVTLDNLRNPFLNTNPLLFTEMHDLSNTANDISLTGAFDLADGSAVTTRLGYYRSVQKIEMDWHWNESIQEAHSDDPARIDLFDAAGNRLTDAGLTGYNNQWGCCARNYDVEYTTNAVYATASYEKGPLSLDGAVRYETFDGDGSFAPHGPQGELDVNGDGVLSIAEQNVYRADVQNALPVDYDLDYTSWSVGVNYLITDDLAIFARASEGHRAVADRLIEVRGNWIDATGDLSNTGKKSADNEVTQEEIGIKYRGDFGDIGYSLFATVFHAEVEEFSTDLTVGGSGLKVQGYETYGIEFESTIEFGENFFVNFNATYTDAEIVEDNLGGNEGNIPLATPDWMYLIAPTYRFNRGEVGMSLRGITETYSSDGNGLKIDGEYFVNAFARYEVMEDLEIALNVNNLLDDWGQAGRLDQGSPADVIGLGARIGSEAVVTNRAQFGRTISATLKYRF